MIKNSDYILTTIHGEDYLLPIAQNVADQKNSLKLNKTGRFLWEEMDKYSTIDELTTALMNANQLAISYRQEVTNDVISFLRQLEEAEIIPYFIENDRYDASIPTEPLAMELNIGSISIAFYGPATVFSSKFLPFQLEKQTHSLDSNRCTITVSFSEVPEKNCPKLIFNTNELTVYEGYDFYKMLFIECDALSCAYLKADGKEAIIYANEGVLEEDIFHAIRFIFAYMAQKQNLLFIHSASVLYQDYAYLFSAPSGTGKSTHAKLWEDVLQTRQLNGDLNLIGIKNDIAYVFPTPWCGTSDICTNDTFRLGGIVLLSRNETDYIEELSETEQIFLTLQRSISPKWSKHMLDCQIEILEKIIPQISVVKLFCTPNPTAVTVISDYIKTHKKEQTCQK